MSISNIAQISPKGKPRPIRGYIVPQHFDPLRRFVASYSLQAVIDYFWPSSSVSNDEWLSAREFYHSQVGQEILIELGIPINQIMQLRRALDE